MLNREENEILCRVGSGTPMGEVFRRFWIPALLPWELPEPDCAPVRLRLLGENLIAFRDTDGKVGVVAENCPHRGASLFLVEMKSLACDACTTGGSSMHRGHVWTCPMSRPESNFKHKVKITVYPTLEQGGIIWVYMGAPENQPELTGFLSNS